MRWGLVARSETDRGIGNQTFAMYENLKPDKTLVVIDQKSGFASHPENYPNETVVNLKHGPMKNTLPEVECRDWLSGLDVVFTVETFYDWDFISWAKDAGVATIVHGNPEFYMASNPQPDLWCWPTTWRSEHAPPNSAVLHVPVPDRPFTAGDPHEGMLRALHIAGNRAMGDRNGTDIVHDALRQIAQGVKMTVYSQAPIPTMRSAVPRRPVADRWDMYAGQHVLVLPRRYGGLCLPALEAMACGLAVVMSDTDPNQNWRPVILCGGENDRVLRMQCGEVTTFRVYPNVLANQLKALAGNRNALAAAQSASREWANSHRWKDLARQYYYMMDYAIRHRN